MRYALLFFSLAAGLSAQTVNVTFLSGNGMSAVTGTEFATPISVKITNPITGLPVAGTQVTVTLPPDGTTAGAFFNFGVLTLNLTTNSQGVATTGILAANNWVGMYQGTVTVQGQKVNFTLANTGYEAPSVTPTSLSFTMNLGDPAPPSQTVLISSPTDGYTATTDQPFCKLTSRSNNVLVVAIDPTNLGVGRYACEILINGITVVPVSLTIGARPALFTANLAGGGLSFSYTQFTPQGSPRPLDQFVTIWSSQANFPVVVDESYISPTNGKWLAAASKRGTVTPVTLEVVVDPTGLAPGTYQANIRVTASTASNSPLLVPVTLTVRRFPLPRQPEIDSLTNGASFADGAISTGALASAATTGCEGPAAISVDGVAAQLVAAKGNRTSFIVPEVGGRTRSQVAVTCDGQATHEYGVPVSAAAPGFFTNDDGSALADQITFKGRRAVRLYGTGFGPMNGDTPSLPVRVWMNGVQGSILSVRPSTDLAGVTELVVAIPDTVDPGSTVSLNILFDDASAQPGLKLVVN